MLSGKRSIFTMPPVVDSMIKILCRWKNYNSARNNLDFPILRRYEKSPHHFVGRYLQRRLWPA